MTPLDVPLLLTSLEAIEHICTQEKAGAPSKKASNKGKKCNKQPGTQPMARVPKKACIEKRFNLFKWHGGMHNAHNTRDCCKYDKDRKEKSNFMPPRKAERNPIPQGKFFAVKQENG
jgi:hypothetical protein